MSYKYLNTLVVVLDSQFEKVFGTRGQSVNEKEEGWGRGPLVVRQRHLPGKVYLP